MTAQLSQAQRDDRAAYFRGYRANAAAARTAQEHQEYRDHLNMQNRAQKKKDRAKLIANGASSAHSTRERRSETDAPRRRRLAARRK